MKLPDRIVTTDVRADEDTYTILVNDEPLRTPKGYAVTVRSWALANAIADDLMAEGLIDPQQLTLYTLYATQRDFIDGRLEGTVAVILQHLPGDFVLHPDADPLLASKQLAAWAPLWQFLRTIGPEVPVAEPLQRMEMPWELTDGLRTQLIAMSPAQLAVVLAGVTNFGSVALGMLLAQHAIAVDQAVAALTVTARHTAHSGASTAPEHERFVADSRRMVQRMLQYVRLQAM